MENFTVRVIVALIGLLLCSFANGQSSIKKAERLLKHEHSHQAVELLESSLGEGDSSAKLFYTLGVAYLHGLSAEQGLLYIEKARAMDPQVGGSEQEYWMGRAMHYNGRYKDALKYLDSYQQHAGRKKANEMEVEKWRRSADLASRLPVSNQQSTYTVRVLPELNTEYMEHSPTIAQDGNTLMYTTRRGDDSEDKSAADGQYFEDIMIVKKQQDATWATPQLAQGVNTNKHDATVQLYDEDTKLLIYHAITEGDLYMCEKQGGDSWGVPMAFPKPINSPDYEAHAHISEDGLKIVFSSNRGGGDLNLYTSEFNAGKWSKPVALENLNTEHDEDAPFITADGGTLYFSSKGHNSIGGYDIFKSEWDQQLKQWGPPQHMGLPFNSARNDLYMIWDNTGDKGYFASGRMGGKGGLDLFEISKAYHVNLEGIVLNQQNNQPVHNIHIEVLDSANMKMYSAYSDSLGRYEVVLPSGASYQIKLLGQQQVGNASEVLQKHSLKIDFANAPGIIHKKDFLIDLPVDAPTLLLGTKSKCAGKIAVIDADKFPNGSLKVRSQRTKALIGELKVVQGIFEGEVKCEPSDILIFDFYTPDGKEYMSVGACKTSGMGHLKLYADPSVNESVTVQQAEAQLNEGKIIRFKTLLFDYQSDELLGVVKRQLDEVVALSKSMENAKIMITGHNFGFKLSDYDLSQRRILRIIQYLESKGVDGEHIHYSYNDQDEAFRKRAPSDMDEMSNFYNRRVDVKVYPLK